MQKENKLELLVYSFLENRLALFCSYHWLCAAVKKSRCGSEWFCTRCKGKQLEEVTKLIYKAWLGSAKNREVDTDDFWTSLSQSEALEAVLVNGEGSDAMKDSSVSEESIEAMEEWLKKN